MSATSHKAQFNFITVDEPCKECVKRYIRVIRELYPPGPDEIDQDYATDLVRSAMFQAGNDVIRKFPSLFRGELI